MKHWTRRNEKIIPDLDELDAKFHYDPETGQLYRKVYGDTEITLKPVKSKSKIGTVRVNPFDGTFAIHRVAWNLYYREDTPSSIKHLNGDTTDNRIVNLASIKMLILAKVKHALAGGDMPHYIYYEKRRKQYRVEISYRASKLRGGRFPCRLCALFGLRNLANKID